MEYQNIDLMYDLFKKECNDKFKERFGDSLEFGELTYKYQNQTFESNVVKKAKMLIFDYYKSKGGFLFNEISARKGKESGAPVIDLYDFDKRFGMELHWHSQKLVHKIMIERMINYKKIFGECILVLLSYGIGNPWKRKQGINHLQDYSLKKYTDAGIKVIFFNIDEPVFDWLK